MTSAEMDIEVSTNRQIAKYFAAALLLVASLALLTAAVWSNIASNDFICYWSAAKTLQSNHNAYDSSAILAIERSYGAKYTAPYIMRNPPWALFLVTPLGLFPAPIAAFFWMSAIISAAFLSLHLLKQMPHAPVAVFLFAPLLACVKFGQTGTFLLLGIALFFRYVRSKPFFAGMALILPALKPHLFLLLWPLLLFDCLRKRQFRVLAGAATSFALACTFALLVDHDAWNHYLIAARSEHIEAQHLATLGWAMRSAIAPSQIWIQFVPALLGIAWAFHRYHAAWNWLEDGSLLVAASVLVSPYSWPTDQVLLLPFVLCAFRYASKRDVVVFGAVNVAAICSIWQDWKSLVTLWMIPAWTIWCWWVKRNQEMNVYEPPPPEAAAAMVIEKL